MLEITHKIKDYLLIKKSGLFDEEYYCLQYPDVRQADVDPLWHFVSVGWKEGRDPSPVFITVQYLEANVDVGAADVNPLTHYILFGDKEKRLLVPPVLSSVSIPIVTLNTTNEDSKENNKYLAAYNAAINKAIEQQSNNYVEYETHETNSANSIKVIAFYLPQFHPFPENDLWWGKGFTEWTNVSKAIPQFLGQKQPHLPGELGFYDLRIPEVQERQVELAKNYQISGFCFYYYWFDGKRLLNTPLDNFVNNPRIDFPFCLCWANENWTRRWDGAESEVLISQDHNIESDSKIVFDLIPYLMKSNYITVEGRPLILIYRKDILSDCNQITRNWREAITQAGLPDPMILIGATFGNYYDPTPDGFDGIFEFPPHSNPDTPYPETLDKVTLLNPDFQGNIYFYKDMVNSFAKSSAKLEFPIFRTVTPSWDNEARKPGRGTCYHESTPQLYRSWLDDALLYTKQRRSPNKQLIFINAWNEWGEGAHLEPDREHGYAYLQETYDAIKTYVKSQSIEPEFNYVKNIDVAVICHLFYPDQWPIIADKLQIIPMPFDLYITHPSSVLGEVEKIKQSMPNLKSIEVINRGRDIAPFYELMTRIDDLHYKGILKLHTKKTVHRVDGQRWFKDILGCLLPNEIKVNQIINKLRETETPLIIAPSKHVLYSENYWGISEEMVNNKQHIKKLSEKLNISTIGFPFVAGSMFWASPKAFSRMIDLDLGLLDFELELGQKDGTLAHAMERFLGLLAYENASDFLEIDNNGDINKIEIKEVRKRTDFDFAMATNNGKPIKQ